MSNSLSLSFHSLLELIYTSACINELLLTCIERVAVGADINSEIFLCGKSLESRTASTLHSYELCLRMDSFFHFFHLLIKDMARNRLTYAIPDFVSLAILLYSAQLVNQLQRTF